MILDEWIPKHHFSEKHSVITQATPGLLYDSIVAMDLAASPLVRFLYSLRRMPRATLTLEGMKEIGFSVLGMKEEREYVIGLVGRFWKPVPEIIDIRPDSFASFNEEGYAKAALNFLIGESIGGNRQLSTETRVYCTSLDARIRFSAYWAVIRPFSGLIRKAMLKEIIRGTERSGG